jgi:hypothetical protein
MQKSYSITSSYEAPLSVAVQKEYNKLLEAVVGVPDNYRTVKEIEGTGVLVSIADLIAYQIGWGRLLIAWYEAGLAGKMPMMPGEGFATWDYTGLARHFYDKYQYDSAHKQLREFHAVVLKTLAIIEHEYKTENLDKVGVWAWCTLPSGKQWPLSKWITINTASPYKRASALVRKFLKVI